ncbi:MAG: hypothetical protein D6690_00125 [Nitrospirae bacterium]|nr:MAG: hypothetical protein D6690_00125 [Nitrospirota bacterium]
MTGRLLAASFVLIVFTTACAGHLTLTQETQLAKSQSVFLEPTKDKTAYLEIRNASDNPGLTLSGLQEAIAAKGYTLVEDPEQAHFLVQSEVVYCNKAKGGTTADTLLAAGWGGAIGAVAGTGAFLGGGSPAWIPGLGIGGALAGAAASKLTENTTYVCAIDVQITERTKEAVQQTITQQAAPAPSTRASSVISALIGGTSVAPPTAGNTQQQITETRTGHTRIHQVRFVVSTTKMWLGLDEATPALEQRLVQGISGVLP